LIITQGHGICATECYRYTKSALVEQSTPAAFKIHDTLSRCTNVTFIDLDLDATQLGGDVTWFAPDDVAHVIAYRAYLATGAAAGSTRSAQVDSEVPAGSNNLKVFLPPETAVGSWTHFTVYARSSIGEQTTPSSELLSDSSASVTSVSFIDKDLDAWDLGGNVNWTAPVTDVDLVTHYLAYIAEPSVLFTKSRISLDVPVGTNFAQMLPEQPHSTYTRILVFTKSSLVEQSSPVIIPIVDWLPSYQFQGWARKSVKYLESSNIFEVGMLGLI